MNNSPVGWPGAAQPPQNAGSGWQRSSHGNSGYGWNAWPRHSRLKPSPGSRLLSGAEGWWDASVYSDSSRVWRNLGTAGPCANFVRNTVNPFVYLTPEATDYLWFLGKNGVAQSLTCTAPIDAVSYIAYDVSTTSTSGAVTGGATFTFESAGKWTRVSLLDVFTNVVAEFVTNDSATFGYTDNYGVGWSIGYFSSIGTQYTRPAIVRSREKGGLPFFSMGAKNDAVASRWECNTAGGTFDITSGNNMTVFAVVRHNTSAAIYGDYIGWGLRFPSGSDGTVARWGLSVGYLSTGGGYVGVNGTCNGLTTTTANWSVDSASGINTLGKRVLLAMVVNSQGRSVNIYINATPFGQFSSPTLTKGMQGVPAGGYLQVGGNLTNSAWYAAYEMYATGFFRRALTVTELQTIADHYGCE